MNIDKVKVHNRVRIGYGTAFFLLLISYVITLVANKKLLDQAEFVDHTNKTIIHLEGLLSNIKDAETGVRGYLLTRDTLFLEPWYQSRQRVDGIYHLLEREISVPQQPKLDTVNSLIHNHFAYLGQTVDSFRAHGLNFTLPMQAGAPGGRETMDSLRALVFSMQTTEDNTLQRRKADVQRQFQVLNVVIVVSVVIAFLLLIFGFFTYTRENKARQDADKKVQLYQDQLRERIMELRSVNKELLQMRSIEKFASTGRIARTIAHEVRNPLTNINLALEQLKSEIGVTDDNAILFDMIKRNSNRINQLITDLLNSTKFAELSYGKISINQIMDEALELAGDRIALYHITVVKRYSEDICEVAVDTEKIKIAFLNIIVNAIEAMEPGKGQLTITTRGENNKCIIEIADNGSGMDKESMSRLFEPYFTSKPKGNGLGLTNTQNIILNHKGTIQAESEKGVGTTFITTLDFAH